MTWQEKYEKWRDSTGYTNAKVARMIGSTPQGFQKVLSNSSGWETVKKAIELAKMMNTTVEDLFDVGEDWPPRSPQSDYEQILTAIEALARTGRQIRRDSAPTVR